MSIQNPKEIENVKVMLIKGDSGSSIESIEKTGSSGDVDTYTITLTDGTKTTFNVTNGSSIASITKTGTQGAVDTYTITLTDGTVAGTFTVTNATGTIDDSLSMTSENPPQNAIVTQILYGLPLIGTTEFNTDGSITTTFEDDSEITTTFNADGSITYSLTDGTTTIERTQTFNADGSITVIEEVQ
jgi:hypothetical protein